MTPGSHLGEEVMFGKSAYKQIAPSELNSKYVRNANKMPLAREGSLLNSINDHGLLSYTDFHFLLLLMSTPSISQKRKEKMIKLVEAEFKGKSDGISFESFKPFYNVLFGGADLERAMFFLDSENQGVTRDEFGKVANWVVGTKVDPHVIEVVYCLLDEDGDRNLSAKEFNPVLFSWRPSRGFQNGALSVTLGNMKF